MRPSLKFLKHAPRGLKHLKGKHHKGKGLEEEIIKIQPTIGRVQEEVSKVTPLRFKSRL